MIYEIAGLRIDIKNRCRYTENFCKEYLAAEQDAPSDLTAVVTTDEFYAEKGLSPNFSDGYVENICLYRSICKQLPVLNRMLLHAAVLDFNGNGYAFLGRSGTGKSTHTGLWMKYLSNVKIINGDKPILQSEKEGFKAYGTPWMGKEGFGCNQATPLKGLCFLEQAKENSIRPLIPSEVASRLFSQILIPDDEENAAATLELADKLINQTPAYLLKCNISEEAAALSFETMTGEAWHIYKRKEEN